jgi:hypothetical protein
MALYVFVTYISVDDFINAKEITKGKELYNSETEKLMSKK